VSIRGHQSHSPDLYISFTFNTVARRRPIRRSRVWYPLIGNELYANSRSTNRIQALRRPGEKKHVNSNPRRHASAQPRNVFIRVIRGHQSHSLDLYIFFTFNAVAKHFPIPGSYGRYNRVVDVPHANSRSTNRSPRQRRTLLHECALSKPARHDHRRPEGVAQRLPGTGPPAHAVHRPA